MKRSLLVVIVAIVVIIVSALLYVLLKPETDPVETTNQVTNNKPVDNTDETVEQVTRDGLYQDYSESAFNNTDGTRLLFFHAPWCPQCRELDVSIKEEGIPSGVTVFKVDYDSNQKLRQKYGVMIQTTVVKVDDQGNKVENYVAYEEPDFKLVEAALLP